MFLNFIFRILIIASPVFFSQGWKWHSPACYWVGEDLHTFDEARKSCEDHGATLVTITNRCV